MSDSPLIGSSKTIDNKTSVIVNTSTVIGEIGLTGDAAVGIVQAIGSSYQQLVGGSNQLIKTAAKIARKRDPIFDDGNLTQIAFIVVPVLIVLFTSGLFRK